MGGGMRRCGGRGPGVVGREAVYKVGSALAAALCVLAEVLRRVGLFDPLFFTYHEEGDFFQRARYHGVRTLMVTGSRINHWHTGVRQTAVSLKTRVIMARNSGLLQLKNPARSFTGIVAVHLRRDG